jgi:hypothetical protein
MWPLRWFRYDEGITADEVYTYDSESGELDLHPRDLAIAGARERGLSLFLEWPQEETTGPPTCRAGKVTLPLQWEQIPDPVTKVLDEQLWFEAPCGGRDLLTGNGNTFPGRMAAWCPDKGVAYSVSLFEMGEMSQPARYFVAGFLAGNQPAAPPMLELPDGDQDIDEADYTAWVSAMRRFRQEGMWHGRWNTCQICGRVLLPDTAANKCQAHTD